MYFNLDPFYRYNGGPWTKFGFGPYSYCNIKYSSLFNCNRYPSSFRTNSFYCNPLRDTVMLNCFMPSGLIFKFNFCFKFVSNLHDQPFIIYSCVTIVHTHGTINYLRHCSMLLLS